jgi:hypothetical protein
MELAAVHTTPADLVIAILEVRPEPAATVALLEG